MSPADACHAMGLVGVCNSVVHGWKHLGKIFSSPEVGKTVGVCSCYFILKDRVKTGL